MRVRNASRLNAWYWTHDKAGEAQQAQGVAVPSQNRPAVTAALLQDAAGMQLDSADNVEREFQADSTLMAHRQRRRVLDLEPMIDAERTVVRTEPLRDDALATERAGVAGIYNRATYANETRIALMSRHSVNSRRARFARFSSMPCSRSDRVSRTVSDTVPG